VLDHHERQIVVNRIDRTSTLELAIDKSRMQIVPDVLARLPTRGQHLHWAPDRRLRAPYPLQSHNQIG